MKCELTQNGQVIGIWFCPESPRWCLKKGKVKAAYKSLVRLRTNELQAARDVYYIQAQLDAEEQMIKDAGLTKASNFFGRFIELFTGMLWGCDRCARKKYMTDEFHSSASRSACNTGFWNCDDCAGQCCRNDVQDEILTV